MACDPRNHDSGNDVICCRDKDTGTDNKNGKDSGRKGKGAKRRRFFDSETLKSG